MCFCSSFLCATTHHPPPCLPTIPPVSHGSRSQTHQYHPLISCIFEFDWSTPRTLLPPHIPIYPTFSALSSQSGLLFFDHAFPSLHSFIATFGIFLYPVPTLLPTYQPPTYLPTTQPDHPHPILLPAVHHQQTYTQVRTRENILLEIFATAPQHSLSLSRRHLGRSRW